MSQILYTGTHPSSFRSGQKAEVKGVFWDDKTGHACFSLEYEDGVRDHAPICDHENYKLEPKKEKLPDIVADIIREKDYKID